MLDFVYLHKRVAFSIYIYYGSIFKMNQRRLIDKNGKEGKNNMISSSKNFTKFRSNLISFSKGRKSAQKP